MWCEGEDFRPNLLVHINAQERAILSKQAYEKLVNISIRERWDAKIVGEVVYTAHLRARLKLRRFPADLPHKIFEHADRRYLNGETGHMIAVKQVRLRGRTRRLMIAYDETRHVTEIVTIHPISEEQERSRVKGGRWTRLGWEVSESSVRSGER